MTFHTPSDSGLSVGQNLHRLIYTSTTRPPGEETATPIPDLEEIIATSQDRNATVGITGVLIQVGEHVIQILEGPSANLEATFERICRDMRHRNLSLIDFSPIATVTFGQWSMKRVDASATQDKEQFVDLVMSISAGMAPAAIVDDLAQLLKVGPLHAAEQAEKLAQNS